jgi:hypothetical protein
MRTLLTLLSLITALGLASSVDRAQSSSAAPAEASHRSRCHQSHTCPSDHATYRWRGLLCVKPKSDKRDATFTRRVKHAGLTYFCQR